MLTVVLTGTRYRILLPWTLAGATYLVKITPTAGKKDSGSYFPKQLVPTI